MRPEVSVQRFAPRGIGPEVKYTSRGVRPEFENANISKGISMLLQRKGTETKGTATIVPSRQREFQKNQGLEVNLDPCWTLF